MAHTPRTSLLEDFPPVKQCEFCCSEWVTDLHDCPDCGSLLEEQEGICESKKLAVWAKNLQRFVHKQMSEEKVSVKDDLFQQVYELSSYLSLEAARQEMRSTQQPLKLVVNRD